MLFVTSGTKMKWDRAKVVDIYGVNMGDKICDLPLLREGLDDIKVWYHSPNLIYTIKSRYS